LYCSKVKFGHGFDWGLVSCKELLDLAPSCFGFVDVFKNGKVVIIIILEPTTEVFEFGYSLDGGIIDSEFCGMDGRALLL